MADAASQVLAAIVPNRRDLLIHALHHLSPEHFRLEIQRSIFNLLSKYFDVAGDVLPASTLADLLERQGVDEAKSLIYEETYAELIATPVAEHEYKYAVDALKDKRAQHLTGEAITTAFEVLENGTDVEGVPLKGHEAARSYLYARLGDIDRLNHQESAPEGDIRREAADILQDYADRKAGKSSSGVLSGIPGIDTINGGFQNGELVLVCAYTAQGKSQLCTQTAWDAAVVQGKNVYFATSETIRVQVRRRLIARHSRLPQFGLKDGLNVRDIRDGTLDEKGEQILQAVVQDLDKNPTYGRIHIAQIPRGATPGFLEARMKRQAEQWEIQLAVCDSINLLKADRPRGKRQEELNDILQDVKVLATSFYDGEGIPLLSPWQMSQNAFTAAKSGGLYKLANLADTSEAEKSADQIISILRYDDAPLEAKLQFLKNRDGEIPEPFTVSVDYRNAYLGQKAEFGTGGSDDDGEDDFLSALGG